MRIKIVSDGTGRTTKVVNAETGEQMDNVTGVRWECRGWNGIAEATITVIAVPVELMATAAIEEVAL